MAKSSKRKLNALGEYLERRSVNKAEVCRKTGIHPTRMTWLCYESIIYLRASELQLIAKAIKVDPGEMLNDLLGHLELKEIDSNLSDQEKLNLQILELLKLNDNLLNKFELTFQDINRISTILAFSIERKTDEEILAYLGLLRKSSNFVKTLKACVVAGWLKLTQSQSKGELINFYTTTEEGKQAIQLPK